MADVIHKLLQRSHRTLITSSFGLLYPQVYRITPYGWDSLGDKPEDSVAATVPGDPYYSFDEEGSNMPIRWSKVKATPIKGLDSEVDTGLLFIRHHETAEEASGYFEALNDFYLWSDRADYDLSFAATQTQQGYFTMHRRVVRLPKHNRLAVYVAIHPDAKRPDYRGDIDQFQIVMPDGSISTDSDQLYDDL